MTPSDLRRKLARSGRFDEATAVEVDAVQVNDYGEGEYEARFAFPRGFTATGEADFLLRVKQAVEDVLPRAWVVAFTVSSDREEANEVVVTFDYLPEGSLAPS